MKLPNSQIIQRVLDDNELKNAYQGKSTIVFGADGFLGSYTALALHKLGAKVTIFSRRNQPILHGLGMRTVIGDIMSTPVLERAVQEQDIIFDLAGSSGGVESNRNGNENLNRECAPHLNLFQVASESIKQPTVVFCSTRTVYGKVAKLPVDEATPLNPQTIYAVHKLTLENYLKVYHNIHGLDYVIFRLSNPYGPFPWQMGKSYGILNQFIIKALHGDNLPIFGDGEQLRDYIFVEDVVAAFLKGAIYPNCRGQILNLGGPSPISVVDAARQIVEYCPESKLEMLPWPRDFQQVETGDYVTDMSSLKEKMGWQPSTGFDEGLERTLKAYQPWQKNWLIQPQISAAVTNPGFWRNKRVLITGASGSLGSFMLNVLLGLGAEVVALWRSTEPQVLNPEHAERLLTFHKDFSDPDCDLHELLESLHPEVVFHFASVPDGEEAVREMGNRMTVHTNCMLKLLQGCQSAGVKAFVIGDTCKVYGNSPVPHREHSNISPQTSYSISKYAAWSLAKVFFRDHRLPVCALRPTLIYGPGQAFNLFSYLGDCVKQNKKEVVLNGGIQTRDPLYISDAALAFLLAAENIHRLVGRALPIGGGHEFSVLDLSRKFFEAAGHQVDVQICPQKMRSGDMLRSKCDNIEAGLAFHWKPRYTLEDGLRNLAQYLLAQPLEQDEFLKQCQADLLDHFDPARPEDKVLIA